MTNEGRVTLGAISMVCFFASVFTLALSFNLGAAETLAGSEYRLLACAGASLLTLLLWIAVIECWEKAVSDD